MYLVDWLRNQKVLARDDNWEEPLLPGLDLSPLQLFWVTYGQCNCEKFKNDAFKRFLKTDSHSPGEFRVKGPLMNEPNFANDFNCPLGSHMNPVAKFSIW